MADTEATKSKNIDVWLVLVIIVVVASMGTGLWVTGKSVLARLDEVEIKTRSQLGSLRTEVFSLRKEVQDLRIHLTKGAKPDPAAAPAAAPAPAPAPAPAKAPAKAAP